MTMDQGSPQWVRERIGKATASRMADIMAVLKTGKPAQARIDYAKQLVAERMTDCAAEFYVTQAMQHGIDNEAPAAQEFEAISGEILLPAQWVPHPEIENFGATPDRLLGDDGLVEIKCPTTAKYVQWRIDGQVPAEHVWQMVAQLACTRRRYCVFVAYDPRVVVGQRLFVRKFEPAAEQIKQCEAEAIKFLKEVEKLFELVTETA